MNITDTIQFDESKLLSEQSIEFQEWFAENCQPNITFADGKNGSVQTCATFDQFGRPSTWIFENITVEAIYFTENQNYTFNKFIFNGNI